jgi:hypothetical protein
MSSYESLDQIPLILRVILQLVGWKGDLQFTSPKSVKKTASGLHQVTVSKTSENGFWGSFSTTHWVLQSCIPRGASHTSSDYSILLPPPSVRACHPSIRSASDVPLDIEHGDTSVCCRKAVITSQRYHPLSTNKKSRDTPNPSRNHFLIESTGRFER